MAENAVQGDRSIMVESGSKSALCVTMVIVCPSLPVYFCSNNKNQNYGTLDY